jgi:AcrR family transcriptional regulator
VKPKIRSFSDNPALVKERRKQIAEHSAAVIVKRGFEKTTIRQIAKACRLPVGTLYYYGGSKEDVLYLVIDNGLSNFQRFCNDIYESIDTMSATEGLRVAIRKYYQLIDDSQNLVLFSFQEAKN